MSIVMDTEQECYSTPKSYCFDYDTNKGDDLDYPFVMTPILMDTEQECYFTPNPYCFDYDTNMGDAPDYPFIMIPPLVDTEQMIYNHEFKMKCVEVQIFCTNNQIVFTYFSTMYGALFHTILMSAQSS